MKFLSKMIGTAAVLYSVLVLPANAAVINMGQVGPTGSGTVSGSLTATPVGPFIFGSSTILGQLASNSQIVFTYTIPGLLGGGLNGYSSYGYNNAGTTYSGTANADSSGYKFAVGQTNGSASAPLALATANLGATTGTVTFTNLSGGWLSFQSIFAGILSSASGFQVSYNIGQVPLPAALPLFAAAVAGMFGFARRQKKMAA